MKNRVPAGPAVVGNEVAAGSMRGRRSRNTQRKIATLAATAATSGKAMMRENCQNGTLSRSTISRFVRLLIGNTRDPVFATNVQAYR